MSFSNLMTDTIKIVRTTGETYENIKASVQKNMVIIFTDKMPLDQGDEIHRETPEGTTIYVVEDPGYYTAMNDIPAHYQAKIRRANSPRKTPVQINVGTMSGNAKVNIDSTDNSTNSTHKGNIYNTLRDKISTEIHDENIRDNALSIINELEIEKNKESFRKKLKDLLEMGAHVVSIVAPFRTLW